MTKVRKCPRCRKRYRIVEVTTAFDVERWWKCKLCGFRFPKGEKVG